MTDARPWATGRHASLAARYGHRCPDESAQPDLSGGRSPWWSDNGPPVAGPCAAATRPPGHRLQILAGAVPTFDPKAVPQRSIGGRPCRTTWRSWLQHPAGPARQKIRELAKAWRMT